MKIKNYPMFYSNTILDDIFGQPKFGNPMLSDISSIISDFFDLNEVGVITEGSYPVFNQHLTKDGATVYEIAITGFSKEDVSIKVINNELVVKTNKKENQRKDIVKTFVNKIASRNFEFRSFLSEKMDIDKIECSVENGLLSIAIPLKDEMKPKNREIEIS